MINKNTDVNGQAEADDKFPGVDDKNPSVDDAEEIPGVEDVEEIPGVDDKTPGMDDGHKNEAKTA